MVISSPEDLFVIVVMDQPAAWPIMGPDLLQLTGHVVKRDDVASLEDVSNHVISPVLALRPQPQCGSQVRGFGDEVAAAVGVAQLVGVGLDLPLRPGNELVQAVH